MACQQGHNEVVSLLLADTRIDINTPERDQCSPLWMASQSGRFAVVQLILASGREIETQTKSIAGSDDWNYKTAAEIGRFQEIRLQDGNESEEEYFKCQRNDPIIADLLDSFDLDPTTTRQQLRELPELRDVFISDLFAIMIFLCDGLFAASIKSSAFPSSITSQKAARFFLCAQRLPFELQMMLCNRSFGSAKDTVLTKHSEPAFKKLGRWLATKDSR